MPDEKKTITVEIKHRWTGAVLLSAKVDAESAYPIRDAIVQEMDRWRRGERDLPRLDGASLVGARLDGARLVGARLDGASLDGARLDGARLDGARLDGARLDGASLDGA